MGRSTRLIVPAAIALGALLAAACFGPAVGQDSGKTEVDNREGIRLIRGYRQWTKANTKPVLMQPAAAWVCAAASPNQQASPHLKKYITVYVNKPGQAAMMLEQTPRFPVGTVIVKEKLSKPGDKTPELMTVMVKRGTGFNPENGNWEYLVLDGTGTRVTAQGKLQKCQSCHGEAPAKQSDHVFRDYYLSASQRAALR